VKTYREWGKATKATARYATEHTKLSIKAATLESKLQKQRSTPISNPLQQAKPNDRAPK
jgi:hypothetical protein